MTDTRAAALALATASTPRNAALVAAVQANGAALRAAQASTVATMEREIRSVAASILNRDATRKAHPTYGVTKTSLRMDAARMDGMVALYAVLTGQANFHSAPTAMHPAFSGPGVGALVGDARSAVRGL